VVKSFLRVAPPSADFHFNNSKKHLKLVNGVSLSGNFDRLPGVYPATSEGFNILSLKDFVFNPWILTIAQHP
jgi:hypothetical protein